MSSTIESILAQVKQLPPAEREKLIEILAEETKAQAIVEKSQPIKSFLAYKDRAQEYAWLAQHQREYVGQWVALEGSQLIAHSYEAKEVFAKARASGVERPIVLLVEDPDAPFAGV